MVVCVLSRVRFTVATRLLYSLSSGLYFERIMCAPETVGYRVPRPAAALTRSYIALSSQLSGRPPPPQHENVNDVPCMNDPDPSTRSLLPVSVTTEDSHSCSQCGYSSSRATTHAGSAVLTLFSFLEPAATSHGTSHEPQAA